MEIDFGLESSFLLVRELLMNFIYFLTVVYIIFFVLLYYFLFIVEF